MKTFHFFVEGQTDAAFVKEALRRFVSGEHNDDRITQLKGWTSLSVSVVQRRLDDGDVVLIVFDADDGTKDKGGCIARLAALKHKLGDTLFGNVHVFLLPDNQSDGDLENLLEKMVRDEHRTIIDCCWTGYAKCLAAKENDYNSPTRKSKMREYAAAIDQSVWADQGFVKTFANDSVWNWSSPALVPLKDFLKAWLI